MSLYRFRLGMVVGKFSPLHRGHEHVIKEALKACEQVLVLGYSQPPLAGCGRIQRTAWVARRFQHDAARVINLQIDDAWVQQRCAERALPWQPMPHNDADDDTQQAWLAWLLDGPLGLRPDAMLASETYVTPTCHRLSQTFGHEVTPVSVDPGRHRHPIRASVIRADVHAQRTSMHPDVYQTFVERVVLLGGESSGKTTLAQALAESFQTTWVPEYGRQRWKEQQGKLTLQDLAEIAHIQIDTEEAALSTAHRYLFCDTSALTTLGYAGWMFDTQPEALLNLAQRRYDHVLLCEPDFDFVQDGTRRDTEFQRRQQRWYEEQLVMRGEPVLRVHGRVAERVSQVRNYLAR